MTTEQKAEKLKEIKARFEENLRAGELAFGGADDDSPYKEKCRQQTNKVLEQEMFELLRQD